MNAERNPVFPEDLKHSDEFQTTHSVPVKLWSTEMKVQGKDSA